MGGIECLRLNDRSEQRKHRQGKDNRKMPAREVSESASHRRMGTSSWFPYNLPFRSRFRENTETLQMLAAGCPSFRKATASRLCAGSLPSACYTFPEAHSTARWPVPSASEDRREGSSCGYARRVPSLPAPPPHGIPV